MQLSLTTKFRPDLRKKPRRSSLSSSSRSLHSISAEDSKDVYEPKRRVSFCEIDVVELPMILGDHPACRNGLPVQPDWDASDRYSISVDSFEETRSPHRRSGGPIRISSFDRLNLIRNVPLRDDASPQIIGKDEAIPNTDKIITPPPITAVSEENTKSKVGKQNDELRRLEHRLDVANTRYDMLLSRMDDLELIRLKERIERRRRQRQRRRLSMI
ncbi:unnamed protein product [Cylindrotheca closterium]|uniref:Uncharacterized protein n=1 Tax=Cylindrotheca closterium TaxID=2856 RepID=A0AAD2CNY0_9STRA|nr:unnamed protein product [Cylindrotheca closterium]